MWRASRRASGPRDAGYDTAALFRKFFFDDIRYLLSMDKLWATRTPPTPQEWNEFPKDDVATGADIRDQVVWSLAQCAKVFERSVRELNEKLKVCVCSLLGDGRYCIRIVHSI